MHGFVRIKKLNFQKWRFHVPSYDGSKIIIGQNNLSPPPVNFGSTMGLRNFIFIIFYLDYNQHFSTEKTTKIKHLKIILPSHIFILPRINVHSFEMQSTQPCRHLAKSLFVVLSKSTVTLSPGYLVWRFCYYNISDAAFYPLLSQMSHVDFESTLYVRKI